MLESLTIVLSKDYAVDIISHWKIHWEECSCRPGASALFPISVSYYYCYYSFFIEEVPVNLKIVCNNVKQEEEKKEQVQFRSQAVIVVPSEYLLSK